MIRCKIINFLFSLLPVNRIRGYLIKNHILKCPHCIKRLATASEVKRFLITEDSPESKTNLWPALEAALSRPPEKRKSGRFLHNNWVYAAAGALVLLISGVFILFTHSGHKQNARFSSSESMQIQHIKVHNQPANTFYYQSPESDYIFLWAEKKLTKGDSI